MKKTRAGRERGVELLYRCIYTDPLTMNPSTHEVLETAVAELMLQLQACEKQSAARLDALEGLMYATKMPVCTLCWESLDDGKLLCLLQTKCNKLVCRQCWRTYRANQRYRVEEQGLPESLCPHRICPALTNKGHVLLDDNLNKRIGPCSISCVTTNDKLLYQIALTREKIKQRMKNRQIITT